MPAIPSILIGRVRGSAVTTDASYLQGGSVLSSIGPNPVAATSFALAADNAGFESARAIKFFGTRFCQDFSTSGTLRIKRWNPVSTVWETVVSATLISVDCTGLYPFQSSNGVSGIFCVFTTSNGIPSLLSCAKTTDGITWTVASIGSTPSTFGLDSFGRGHMHRNKLVIAHQDSSAGPCTWDIFDPVGLSASNISSTLSDGSQSFQGQCMGSMTTFNNRLFMLHTRAITGIPAKLYELIGAVWTVVVALPANTSLSAGYVKAAHALVPIGSTKMLAVVKTDNGGSGTRAFDLTPSGSTFTVSAELTTLIPASLQPGGGGGTDDQRWTCWVDDVTDPAIPTQHFWLLSDDITGVVTYYPYVNSSTLMIGSTGPSVNYSLPNNTFGGGSYVASNSDMDVNVTGLTPLLGGTRVSYQGSGLIAAASLRQSVHYATTTAVGADASSGGPGPGKTLSSTGTSVLTFDGVSGFTTALHAGFRFLVKNEPDPRHCGIYNLTSSAGTNWVLTRAADFDQASEVYTGVFMGVALGSTQAGTTWQVSSTGATPVVMETSAINFSQVTSMTSVLWRANCRVATASGENLPAYTASGTGVGKTLTGTSLGILSVDATATVLNNRIVMTNEGVHNGIYKVTTEGTAGVAYVLTRATDFDTVGAGEVIPGAYTYVTAGATLSTLFFELTTAGSGLVIDTTSLDFTMRNPASLAVHYSTAENTNMTQATLYGVATGGASLRNVNQVDRVSPDGVTPFTADWKAGTGGDGLQNGQPITMFPRISV